MEATTLPKATRFCAVSSRVQAGAADDVRGEQEQAGPDRWADQGSAFADTPPVEDGAIAKQQLQSGLL